MQFCTLDVIATILQLVGAVLLTLGSNAMDILVRFYLINANYASEAQIAIPTRDSGKKMIWALKRDKFFIKLGLWLVITGYAFQLISQISSKL